LQDIHSYVLQNPVAGASKTPQEEDIQCIMRTMELDEDIYAISTSQGQMVYTHRNRGNGQPFDIFAGRLPNFLTRSVEDSVGMVVPCLSCHLQDVCHVGGHVCPEKCEYLGNWMSGQQTASTPGALSDNFAMNDW